MVVLLDFLMWMCDSSYLECFGRLMMFEMVL